MVVSLSNCDPLIGRFISADTVIQNLADPQCFNRYSYCLNNPLKYTDPSGNIVQFENEDLVMQYLNEDVFLNDGSSIANMIQQWAELRCTWYTLSTIAPEETQKLENDSAVIKISWSDTIGSQVSGETRNEISESCNGISRLVSADILVTTSYLHDLGNAARTLGHEGFHVIADINGFGDDTSVVSQ